MRMVCSSEGTRAGGRVLLANTKAAYHLVIRGRDDPGVLVMELHSSNVIQMTLQGEQAPAELVVPDLHNKMGEGANNPSAPTHGGK